VRRSRPGAFPGCGQRRLGAPAPRCAAGQRQQKTPPSYISGPGSGRSPAPQQPRPLLTQPRRPQVRRRGASPVRAAFPSGRGDGAGRKRAVAGSQLALLAEGLESCRSSTDLDINQKLCVHVTPNPPPPLNLRKKERKQLQGRLHASSCLLHTRAASSSLRLIGDLQQLSTRIIKMSQRAGWPGKRQLGLFWFNYHQKKLFQVPLPHLPTRRRSQCVLQLLCVAFDTPLDKRTQLSMGMC